MIAEFPLFLFTLLGGAGAGAYAFLAALPAKKDVKPWLAPLAVLVLLAISGLALLTHLGHPERMFFAFSNPTAGITLEGYTMVLFGVLVAVDFIVTLVRKESLRMVRILAAVAGALLLFAMGYAYASFLGVPVWGTWQSYLMFVVPGLALGALTSAFFVDGKNGTLALAAVLLLVLSAVTLAVETGFFAGAGYSTMPFVVGFALVMIAVVVAYLGKKGALWGLPCALVIALAGIAVARYGFYAVA